MAWMLFTNGCITSPLFVLTSTNHYSQSGFSWLYIGCLNKVFTPFFTSSTACRVCVIAAWPKQVWWSRAWINWFIFVSELLVPYSLEFISISQSTVSSYLPGSVLHAANSCSTGPEAVVCHIESWSWRASGSGLHWRKKGLGQER